uniref:Uncharacterized protein n=1 Tax=Anguilla anguilla TaxID=7936 RepID=A0A0E9RXT2_ANGAN
MSSSQSSGSERRSPTHCSCAQFQEIN